MPTAPLVIRVLVVAASLATLPAVATATTVVELTFPDLVRRAAIIAIGTVSEVRAQWDAARQAPFTAVTFANLRVLKGDPGGSTMTLQFLGGPTPEGLVLTIPGMPRFTVGEKNVVFSTGNEQDFCPLVGVWQGLFRVVFDPQRGVETVSDSFHVPVVGIRDGRILKLPPATPAGEALTLPTLVQRIEQELGGGYDQP